MGLSKIIRKIVHNSYNFCCLCLTSLESDEKFYNIADEVILDRNNTQDLFHILNYVIPDAIFNNVLETFGFICHHCTETAIISYKFTKMCQDNALQIWNIVKSLNNYFDEIICKGNKNKQLYVSLEVNNVDIQLYNGDNSENKIFLEIHDKNECILNNVECNQIKESPDNPVNYELQNDICPNEKPLKRRRKPKIDVIRDKTDLSVFKCKICKNIYSREPNLIKHYFSVHAPKIFKCLLCVESFGSDSLLKMHQKHRHTPAVCCTECGKIFSSVYALQNHERRHKLRLVCQHCGKVYKTKQGFKSHIDRLHGRLPKKVNPKFICDYCGKTYSQKSGIRLHVQFEHGNGKYYECEWCKKRFSARSHLKEHTETHTKDKPFTCKLCGGRFSTKMSLLYHTRRHTGEKPYQCDYCDGSFISASRRLSHVKQHHLPAELQCDICLKEFKLKNCLTKHRLKHFDSKSKLHKIL